MFESATIRKRITWGHVITTCGLLSFAFSIWATVDGILRLQNDPSVRVFPLAWLFTYLFGFVALVSWRLVVRRIWAGVVLALLGWRLIFDLLTSPVAKSQMSFGMYISLIAIFVLTVSLFAGKEAWRRGL